MAGETLDVRSCVPKRSPEKTVEETESLIVRYRQEHPAIGAKKILENKGYQALPCVSSISRILDRNGLITRQASLAATPGRRFEKLQPNDMWQGDYKGHFAMGNKRRCHLLNIIDDHSRFNLCCQAPDRPMQLAAVSPGLYGCTDRVFLWHLSGRGSALSAAPPNLQQQQAGCQWGEELFLGNLPYGMGTGFCGECPLKRIQKSCKIVLSIKYGGKLP